MAEIRRIPPYRQTVDNDISRRLVRAVSGAV